jgi:NADPH:quinone reductase-like Zn-dependent oxidoreductase
VLIRVHAATVTKGDCELRGLDFSLMFQIPFRLFIGLRAPKRRTILGQELAGVVEAVGNEVTRFKAGDRVFAPTNFRFGAYAEYATLPDRYLVAMPPGMSYEEAATIPTGGINSLHYVRRAGVKQGQRLLINGAGGSIGTYAVQIAKLQGAEVTAVDSAEKLDMLRSLGAVRVIDYRKEDYTKGGQTYDAIIDVVGNKSNSRIIGLLKPGGRYVVGFVSSSMMLRGPWISRRTGKKVILDQARYNAEEYAYLLELIEAGKVKVIIDRCYPLERTAEAHRYVDSGGKQGNVVITIGQDAQA